MTFQIDCLDQQNVKKENQIGMETNGHFAHEDLFGEMRTTRIV